MDHRAPPPPPPQLELLLPTVVLQKRRRSARTRRDPRQASIPVVPPPAAFPVRSAPRQIPAPPVAAGPAYADNLMLLADTALSQADSEAEASSPPAPAAKKLRSAPALLPPAAADEDKPYAPPLPPPPPAVDEKSSMSTDSGYAAAKASAQDYEQAACPQGDAAGSSKGEHSGGGVASPAAVASPLPPLAVDEKSSMSTTDYGHAAAKASVQDYEKAACPQGDAGSSKGDHSGGRVASPAAAASPQPQPWDDDEELEPGEIPPEKPAAGCNADSAHESLLGKEEETAAGEEDKTTIAREPAAMGSSSHSAPVVANTGVVVRRDGKAAMEMSAEEEKRMREVFVGGLSMDATEKDVRAALSAAGQITEVRMIKDRRTWRANRGYCFVAYRDAAMASKAIAQFGNVKICGKQCRVSVAEGNEKANKIAQRDPTIEDYNRMYEQGQLSPILAAHSSFTSWDHYAISASSYVVPPVGVIPAAHYIPMYHHGNGVYLPADFNHGQAEPWRSQMGQSGSSRPPAGQPPHSRRN